MVVGQALRLLHRALPVAFGCSYCYLCARLRERIRQVVVYVSALVTVFYDEDVTLLVAMAFDSAEKQNVVDVGVVRVEGRASESTMFGGGPGWGCPICDMRAVALAIPPLHLDLAYRCWNVLSWTFGFPVSVLYEHASLTTQQRSGRKYKMPG